MKFSSARSLTIFIVSMTVLTAIAVCLNGATAIIYATSQFLTTDSNPIRACQNTDVSTIKFQTRQLITFITVIMSAAGFLFGIVLTVCLLLSLFLKPGGRHLATKQTFKVLTYIMAALALLTTSIAFGYNLSLMLEYQTQCPSLKSILLIPAIIQGIAAAFFLPVFIMTMLFPNETRQIKYADSSKTMEMAPLRVNEEQKQKIKMKINDQSVGEYSVEAEKKKNEEDTIFQLNKKLIEPKKQQDNYGIKYIDTSEPQEHKPKEMELFLEGSNSQQRINQHVIDQKKQPQKPLIKEERLTFPTPRRKLQDPPMPLQGTRGIHGDAYALREDPIITPLKEVIPNYVGNKQTYQPEQSVQNKQPFYTHSNTIIAPAEPSPVKILQSPQNNFTSSPLQSYSPLPFEPSPRLEPTSSPQRNVVPGLIRSRKRIFDRVSDRDKETFLINELRNRYGMK